MRELLFRAEDLKKYYMTRGFFSNKKILKALDGVSLDIRKNEIFGLVGESGSGKSTFGRCLILMDPPTSGKVFYKGTEITRADRAELQQVKRKLQMIFQDPYASLNPNMSVGEIIAEPMRILNKTMSASDLSSEVDRWMERVRLARATKHRYPYELSGGMRQRVGIARALSTGPEFVLCDEPISALDVSIRGQVLNTLLELKEEYRLTYLFIAHDLPVVYHIADRVAVMYLGKIVEEGDTEKVFRNRRHPYTEELFDAMPILDPVEARAKKGHVRKSVPEEVGACSYYARCPKRTERCRQSAPELSEVEDGHRVACHLYSSSV